MLGCPVAPVPLVAPARHAAPLRESCASAHSALAPVRRSVSEASRFESDACYLARTLIRSFRMRSTFYDADRRRDPAQNYIDGMGLRLGPRARLLR